jgi:hypothetical protein
MNAIILQVLLENPSSICKRKNAHFPVLALCSLPYHPCIKQVSHPTVCCHATSTAVSELFPVSVAFLVTVSNLKCIVQGEPQVPLHLCKKGNTKCWNWESPMHKTLRVATCLPGSHPALILSASGLTVHSL